MLNGLLTIVLFPLILVWSVCYGVLGGVFFKLLAVYENWIDLNRLQIIQWKRYPLRSYNKFTSAILTHRMKSKPIELVALTNSQIQTEYKREPFPFLVILANTLITLVLLPFALLTGIFQGPVFVFRKTWRAWQNILQPRS
ncbi:MAG: hypothetical protein Q8L60_15425 [Gammaproteobacteria bacterium]|nr:hypothetical protein [Gammaproteobacteria bacterium]MDP2141064.1 hypothetical protein [Gammaproteobacteria bacterium]MDP2348522.1 hypothetical protein [Gammaproteobacteria bacterium]